MLEWLSKSMFCALLFDINQHKNSEFEILNGINIITLDWKWFNFNRMLFKGCFVGAVIKYFTKIGLASCLVDSNKKPKTKHL